MRPKGVIENAVHVTPMPRVSSLKPCSLLIVDVFCCPQPATRYDQYRPAMADYHCDNRSVLPAR